MIYVWVITLAALALYAAWVVRDNRRRMRRIEALRRSLADRIDRFESGDLEDMP